MDKFKHGNGQFIKYFSYYDNIKLWKEDHIY